MGQLFLKAPLLGKEGLVVVVSVVSGFALLYPTYPLEQINCHY